MVGAARRIATGRAAARREAAKEAIGNNETAISKIRETLIDEGLIDVR